MRAWKNLEPGVQLGGRDNIDVPISDNTGQLAGTGEI